jgi:hypothetical protein
MRRDLAERLTALRNDFGEVTGRAFDYFYCPILYQDEPTALCRGHVFNEAFPETDRTWTVQRRDVDSFYGAFFEAEFVTLQHKGKYSPFEVLADPELGKRLKPKIVLDGEEIAYYRAAGPIPSLHTPITISGDGNSHVPLVLKLTEREITDSLGGDWQIGLERDLRLPALVSILKSAHLTLFHLMGYRYALSAGGHFLGSDVLGRFFKDQVNQPKASVLSAAMNHFSQFSNMARPVLEAPEGLEATITNRRLYICKTDAWIWAVLVFLRTGSAKHAVLVPVFENHHAIARYLRFIKSPEPEFDAYLAELESDRWSIAKSPHRFQWPDAMF